MNICYAKFIPQVTHIATFTISTKEFFLQHKFVCIVCVILSVMLCLLSIPLLSNNTQQ